MVISQLPLKRPGNNEATTHEANMQPPGQRKPYKEQLLLPHLIFLTELLLQESRLYPQELNTLKASFPNPAVFKAVNGIRLRQTGGHVSVYGWSPCKAVLTTHHVWMGITLFRDLAIQGFPRDIKEIQTRTVFRKYCQLSSWKRSSHHETYLTQRLLPSVPKDSTQTNPSPTTSAVPVPGWEPGQPRWDCNLAMQTDPRMESRGWKMWQKHPMPSHWGPWDAGEGKAGSCTHLLQDLPFITSCQLGNMLSVLHSLQDKLVLEAPCIKKNVAYSTIERLVAPPLNLTWLNSQYWDAWFYRSEATTVL